MKTDSERIAILEKQNAEYALQLEKIYNVASRALDEVYGLHHAPAAWDRENRNAPLIAVANVCSALKPKGVAA